MFHELITKYPPRWNLIESELINYVQFFCARDIIIEFHSCMINFDFIKNISRAVVFDGQNH